METRDVKVQHESTHLRMLQNSPSSGRVGGGPTSGRGESVAPSTPNALTLPQTGGFCGVSTETCDVNVKPLHSRVSCVSPHKCPISQSSDTITKSQPPSMWYGHGPFMVDDCAATDHINVPLRVLLRRKFVSHVRPASTAISNAMKQHLGCIPLKFTGKFTSASLSRLQRELRSSLARNLTQGTDRAAFAKACGVDARPRADDLELMWANFPYPEQIDWAAPDVRFNLNMATWRLYHSYHCTNGCTRFVVQPNCYFIYIEFFLRTGFEPTDEPSAQQPTNSLYRTYVDLWRENQQSCEQAIAKWTSSDVSFISPVTSIAPESCCALLPVIKAKDLWRHKIADSTRPVKGRLCLDLKSSGDNTKIASWRFRYLIMQLIMTSLESTDWLTVLDIDQFYMRLPAGRRMRARQWFQDPESFSESDSRNKRQSIADKTWRQLLAVAFGWKVAPAYASTVSAELVRMLRACGVRVLGTFIDDILIASNDEKQSYDDVALAKTIMAALSLPANAKQKGPCSPETGVPFVGIHVRPADSSLSITAEYRQYVIERLAHVIKCKQVSHRTLESLAGSLTWLCEVMIRGRPRRASIFAALARTSHASDIKIRGELAHQLHWWLNELQSPRAQMIRYWKLPPNRPLCFSDAAGEDGWAACVKGLHFVGRWPPYMRQLSGSSPECTLFMEALPIVVVHALLAPFLKEQLLCAAADNAGAAFSINSFNCRHPATRRLMQILVDGVSQHKSWVVAGHGRRHRNTHTDRMTHSIHDSLWDQVLPTVSKQLDRHIFHFAIMSTRTHECLTAAITLTKASSLSQQRPQSRSQRR